MNRWTFLVGGQSSRSQKAKIGQICEYSISETYDGDKEVKGQGHKRLQLD